MAIAYDRDEFSLALCKALGLERVRRLQIDIAVDEATTVTAEFFPDRESLETVVKKFCLTAEAIEPQIDDSEPKVLPQEAT